MDYVELVAKAICAASGDGWREGTYPVMSGKDFTWEERSADKLNNHWRYKAKRAIEALQDAGWTPPA